VAVDPDGTGLKSVADFNCRVEVLGMNRRSETVERVVSLAEDILDILEFGDGNDGSEDFFLHDLHPLVDFSEDGGLDKISFLSVTFTTKSDLGTLILAGLDVIHNSSELQLGDLRALDGVGFEWIADDVLLGALGESLDELVVDVFLDVDPRASTAALTVVVVDTEVGPVDGLVHVGVAEDDRRRLSAQFQGDILQVAGCSGLHDDATNDSGSGEGDLVYTHVRGDGCTGDLSDT